MVAQRTAKKCIVHVAVAVDHPLGSDGGHHCLEESGGPACHHQALSGGELLDVSGKNAFLRAAAARAREDDFHALLEQRGDSQAGVNFKDFSQRTALMLCSIAGSTSCVQSLLDNKLTLIDCQDMTGSTALMLAAQRGHESIVELLLNHKADHRLRDMGGNTAIILAARRNQVSCLRVMSRFITSAGDWTAAGEFGLTAEQWAVQNGRQEAADFIRQLL